MGEPEAEAARRPILAGWVTQGPEVAAFEREFASFVRAPFACAVSNATVAIQLALLAVGVGPEDEVVTVSHSFIATANAIRHVGAIPVFIDVEPDGFNLDPARIDDAVSARTRAILVVHQLGMPCDLAAIQAAVRGRFPIVEDAACAAGSRIRRQGNWESIGQPHGDVACFSFHPRKVITTGEGGMLTTASADWDARFRLLRQHGMSLSDTTRHGARLVEFERYECVGFNTRITDVQAAIGREQLKRLPAIVAARRRIAARYQELLVEVEGLITPSEPDWAESNWQSYGVWLPEHSDQRTVMQSMLDDGVATRRGVMCAHLEPAYRDQPWRDAGLDESERARDRSILLPFVSPVDRTGTGPRRRLLKPSLPPGDRDPSPRKVTPHDAPSPGTIARRSASGRALRRISRL